MKILLTSDWHLDAVTAGFARVDELRAYVRELGRVLEAAHASSPFDAVFFLGDAHDPGGMLASLFTSIVIDAARMFGDWTPEGSIWIAGNHDVIESSRLVTTLSPLAAVSDRLGARVYELPGFTTIGRLGVLALPYVSRVTSSTSAYIEALEAAYGAAEAHDGPVGVIGHLTVPGALMGSESREMARGRDVDFPAMRVAALSPVFVANGHYHDAQIVEYGELRVIIPGSPARLTFGERNDGEKGYTVIEVDA